MLQSESITESTRYGDEIQPVADVAIARAINIRGADGSSAQVAQI